MKHTIVSFLVALPLMALPMKPPAAEFYKNFPNIDDHPGHYPFISDITFRKACDFVINESTEWFDPDEVQLGDIIYVNIWYLPWFEKHVHDQIKHPYILVSGDVGRWVPDPGAIKKLLYDPKLAAWFCRNMIFSHHPKLYQSPMGQDLYEFDGSHDAVRGLLKVALQKPFHKQHLLYMNHYARLWGDRDKVAKLFENAPYCFSRNHTNEEYFPLGRVQFYEELAASKFVISPLGLETDSVRTWEAFALDCIPVVEHTFLDPHYEGLPIVFVHDWEEINEEFLHEQYEKLKPLSFEKAHFDYWYGLIKNIQTDVRNQDYSCSSLEATKWDPCDVEDLISILREKAGRRKTTLIYRGFLTSIHSLQLLDAFSSLSRIYLFDPWLDQATWTSFSDYLSTDTLLAHQHKVVLIPSENEFDKTVADFQGDPLFLELTYYRSSLLRDYSTFRHALKKEITELFCHLLVGTLLCGNKADDPYVQKALTRFAIEWGIAIETRGHFWFVIKE